MSEFIIDLCLVHVACFIMISNLISDLVTDFISNFEIASMLNNTENVNLKDCRGFQEIPLTLKDPGFLVS